MHFHNISQQCRDGLTRASLDVPMVLELIARAITEDLGGGEDITSLACLSPEEVSVAEFRNRSAGTIAGVEIAVATLEMLGIVEIRFNTPPIRQAEAGTLLLSARGNTRALLLAERSALNFLGHLSGIATLTRRWVDEISEYETHIRDTRKTTPGFRQLDKYAVRVGGGLNHRMTLSESALIKDNHVAAAGGVREAFALVKKLNPQIEIEVEVDTLEQLREIIPLQPDLILLDNMNVAQCREAVAIVNGRVKLEASGGLSLENAKKYAATGVDFLAVGALTHSAPTLDIGLDLKVEM